MKYDNMDFDKLLAIIPKITKMENDIKKALDNPDIGFAEVSDLIVKHMKENRLGDISNYRIDEFADNYIELHLIMTLTVNESNFNRLNDYCNMESSFEIYNRLISDFSKFMINERRNELIDYGKEIFENEYTNNWEKLNNS